MQGSVKVVVPILMLAVLIILPGCPPGGVITLPGLDQDIGQNVEDPSQTVQDSVEIVGLTVDGGVASGSMIWGQEAWYKFTGSELIGYDIRVRGMAGLVVSVFKAEPLLNAEGVETGENELFLQAMDHSSNVLGYSGLLGDVAEKCAACAPAYLQEVRLRQFVAMESATYMILVETFEHAGAVPNEIAWAYYDHFPFSVEVKTSTDVDVVLANNLVEVPAEDAGQYINGWLETDSETLLAFDATAGQRVYVDVFCEDPDARAAILYRHRELAIETPFGNGPNGVIGFMPEFSGTFLLELGTGMGDNIFDTYLYELMLVQDDHANASDVYDESGVLVNSDLATQIALDETGLGTTTGTLFAWDDDVFSFKQPPETPSYVELVWGDEVLADWRAMDDWVSADPNSAQVTDANGNPVPGRFYLRQNEWEESFFTVVNSDTDVATASYTLNISPAPHEPKLEVAFANDAQTNIDTSLVVVGEAATGTFTLSNTGGLPLTWRISKWDLQDAIVAAGHDAAAVVLDAYIGTIEAGGSTVVSMTADRSLLDLGNAALIGTLPVSCDNLFGNLDAPDPTIVGLPIAGLDVAYTVHPQPPVVALVDNNGDAVLPLSIDTTAAETDVTFFVRNGGESDMNWVVTMEVPGVTDPAVLPPGGGLAAYDADASGPEGTALIAAADIDAAYVAGGAPIPAAGATAHPLLVTGTATFDDVTYTTTATVTVTVTR
jgi:hypothetical protein